MKKYILAIFIILTGVFTTKTAVPMALERFRPAQYAYLIFTAGILGSLVLYSKNKWIGLIAGIATLGFFKSFLCNSVSQFYLFETFLIGISIVSIYFFIRYFKFKEDILKWFLVPAGLNILLVFTQAFDGNFLYFLPVEGITGFLGNKGLTACFLGISTPIFLKHFKWGIPFLLIAIILCGGTIGLIAAIVSIMFYLYHTRRNIFKIVLIALLIGIGIGGYVKRGRIKVEAQHRAAMWVGTLHGISANLIWGWGAGSFENIVPRIPQEESKYCGTYFNYSDAKMNNPHNELLLGWWNYGIGFVIVFFGLIVYICRKFTKAKLLSFSVILAGFVVAMGYFMTYPAWILTIIALGVYDNYDNKEVENGKEKKVT